MTDVTTLAIKIKSEGIDKTKKKLKGLGVESEKTEKKAMAVGKAFGIAFAAVNVALILKNVADVNREFESLRTSLITTTGSAEDAATAFEGIKAFASTTPFAVAEVTEAFIKLGNLGLAPSARALTSYGNTAGAMGKSLNQVIEAVADATTGEFERLKEFGIKSASEGDRVTFTFRGMSKEVGKNSKEIQDYILALGENEFAGGMALQAKTLNGSLSNLGDSWDAFVDNLLSGENSAKIAKAINLIGTGIDWLSGKLEGESAFKKAAENLQEQQAVLDNMIEDLSRPRLFRLNVTSSTEELGAAFDIQRAKVDKLKIALGELMLPDVAAGKTFDEIAAGLDKMGLAAEKAFVSMHDGWSLAEDALSALDDELQVFTDNAQAISSAYDSVTESLTQQRTILGLTAREAAIYNAQMQLVVGTHEDLVTNTGELAGKLFDEQEAVKALADEALQAEKAMEALDRASTDWASSFADAMVESTGSLSDFVENALKELQKIAIQQATQPLFRAFGGLLNEGFGDLFGGLASFAGGGFTGSGSRSGGMDGKGGFPAMLHPNETVIDHSKGQNSSGAVSVVVNVDASNSNAQGDTNGLDIGKLIGDSVKSILINERRQGGLLS